MSTQLCLDITTMCTPKHTDVANEIKTGTFLIEVRHQHSRIPFSGNIKVRYALFLYFHSLHYSKNIRLRF